MRENFDAAFNAMLKDEGGYSNDPRDNGGMTNLGVTAANWKAWTGKDVSEADMRALTPASVKPFYKGMYWDKVWGDKLPAGLDYAMFDFAVNSGPYRAICVLQKLVGAAQDGVLGPRTFDAISKADTANLIAQLSAARQKFLQGLTSYKDFGKGWSARVVRVGQLAQKMVA